MAEAGAISAFSRFRLGRDIALTSDGRLCRIDQGQPGACPLDCPALAPCAQRALNGSACQAECVLIAPDLKVPNGGKLF